MRTVFHGKRISALLGVLPGNTIRFEDEIDNYSFPPKQTLRLQQIMGYKTHCVAKPDTAASDFCVAGMDHMLENGWITREEIGGIVVTTTSPDHMIPPVSSILHGHYGLDKDVVCIDINQGCVAFLVGLMEAFLLLEHMEEGKKVIVFASDVLSKKVSRKDRNSWPLIGDGAGIAIVENDPSAGDIHSILYNDGSKGSVLIVPAGGSRMACTSETAELKDDGTGNLRSLDNLTMDGQAVFNFVQECVPPLIDELMDYSGMSKDGIDWFFFHQPNRFMVRKLAERMKVPYEKMPSDLVENYGNSSGACIPINISHTLGSRLCDESYSCVLSAFGSGLCWMAMTIKLGGLSHCELFTSDR